MSLAYRLKSAYHDPMAGKRKQKSASLGCLFWIAFILLVLVLFFFNRDNIQRVLTQTGLMTVITGEEQQVEEVAPSEESEIPAITTEQDIKTEADLLEPEPAPQEEPPAPVKPVETDKPATPETEKPSVKPVAEKPVKTVQTRKATLFFVMIDADGRVVRKEVSREVPKTDSPLSETLNALFSGTTGAEESINLRTLIPQGTRLLSASVKNGVATLNLSEEFQFNQFGIEGYLAQLAQIVFTATSFPTVTSVQFLIEGQRREYLGAEGVWIGTPLSRDKF